MEFSELEISCKTSGWDYSGGRSNNVWGQVPTSHLPIDEINRAIEQGQKSCIWTCYDNAFYSKTKNGKPVTLEELPKTISATFKPTYAKFSAVAENLGMRIAITLGMPTSYNYIKLILEIDLFPLKKALKWQVLTFQMTQINHYLLKHG